MSNPIRIGILGLHHDHIWDNLKELAPLPEGELVIAADPTEALRKQITDEYGCETTNSYDAVINNEGVDAVFVYGSNREGAELAVEAAQAGKHVLIEKPMAADLAGAQAALDAAQANNVRLMINWPFAWWSQLQHAIRIAKAGEVGRLWQVKYRAAHQGPVEMGCTEYFSKWLFDDHLNGGGALMDYCCYGSILSRVLLGQPESVIGMEATLCKDQPVEDNAMLVLRYPKAMATSEASWTQIGKLSSYLTIIYGEEGTLLVEPREGSALLKATNEDEEGSKIDVPEADPELKSASAHFLWAIETGGELHPLCDPVNCRDAQAILEHGRTSAKERKEVTLS
ncbi:MAG: oxidoreductase [Verrucomicrobiales bacterium]|nr:oxidoreductase [Verrucomicrobiales bacterium]|tara:strand:+ start:17 stop:1036 length:1020 start_codon:yes stop_codon:yes gene_type:complete